MFRSELSNITKSTIVKKTFFIVSQVLSFIGQSSFQVKIFTLTQEKVELQPCQRATLQSEQLQKTPLFPLLVLTRDFLR